MKTLILLFATSLLLFADANKEQLLKTDLIDMQRTTQRAIATTTVTKVEVKRAEALKNRDQKAKQRSIFGTIL